MQIELYYTPSTLYICRKEVKVLQLLIAGGASLNKPAEMPAFYFSGKDFSDCTCLF